MKKTAFTLLLGAAALTATAQKYTVGGKLPTQAGTPLTVYLNNMEKETTDSVVVTGDSFSFSGEAGGKIFGMISIKTLEKQIPVILDGDVTVDVEKGTTAGTAENVGLSQWEARLQPVTDGIKALMEEYYSFRRSGQEMPDSVGERLNRQYDELMERMCNEIKTCCTENQNAMFPAYYLKQAISLMENEDVIAIADMQPAFMQAGIMAPVRDILEGWRRQAKGTPFTDLAMADTTGVERHLSEFVGKGKYVLIDFWASWCGPCRQEMPHVKAVYEKYHEKGFDIVGLSFDNNKAAWTAAIKKLDLPWHHLSDLKGWQSVAASTYGINSIPATLLVGPDGKVVASGLRGEELEKTLGEIFK